MTLAFVTVMCCLLLVIKVLYCANFFQFSFYINHKGGKCYTVQFVHIDTLDGH